MSVTPYAYTCVNFVMYRLIGVPGGGAGEGTAALPVLTFFGQGAYDSGKNTWDKLLIESGSYNMTKQSILKSFNGSAANLLSAGNC